MLHIILGGAPGCGKGTQADILVKEYGFMHLSTGEVLRAEIASHSTLGKEIESLISQGQLVPDDKMIALIDNYLEQLPADCKGVLFDGFPRTVAQAEAMTLLLQERGMDSVMFDLHAEEDVLIKRLLNRGKTSGRADDNYETIKKRLKVYHEQTQPVCDYYLRRKKYFLINSNIDPETTYMQTSALLDLFGFKHVN